MYADMFSLEYYLKYKTHTNKYGATVAYGVCFGVIPTM